MGKLEMFLVNVLVATVLVGGLAGMVRQMFRPGKKMAKGFGWGAIAGLAVGLLAIAAGALFLMGLFALMPKHW